MTREIIVERDQQEFVELPKASFEKVGDTLKGTLTKKQQVTSVYGDKMVYEVTTPEGETFVKWGTPQLDERMAFVNLGDIVTITLAELRKTKGGPKPMKVFKVFVDDGLEEAVDINDIPFGN